MRNIVDLLDERTKEKYDVIKLKLAQPQTDKDLEAVFNVTSLMIKEFEESFEKFDLIVPGMKSTLEIIETLLESNNKADLVKRLNNSLFQAKLNKAMAEIERGSSSLNYVYAGLKFFEALVLLYVVVPFAFVFGLAIGVSVAPPYIHVPIALASLLTSLTIVTGVDLVKDGINQIKHTNYEKNRLDSLNMHSLFKQVNELSTNSSPQELRGRSIPEVRA